MKDKKQNNIWDSLAWLPILIISFSLFQVRKQQLQISMSFPTNTTVIQNRADKFVVLTKAKEETEKFSRNSFEKHASKHCTYVQIVISSSRFESIFQIWKSVYIGFYESVLVTLFIFRFLVLPTPDKLLRSRNSAPAKDEHWIIIFGAAASCK